MAAPVAIGVAVGFAGCAGEDSDISLDKADVAQAKADGFGTAQLCRHLGLDDDCDVCEELGWYDDGICDDFCDHPDYADCGIEPPPEGSCLSDAECEDGFRCEIPLMVMPAYAVPPFDPPTVYGTCEPIAPGPCSSDADCPDGFECELLAVALYAVPPIGSQPSRPGICQPVDNNECYADDDCAEGYHCEGANLCPEGAYCILPSTPGECVADLPDDCSSRTLDQCEDDDNCMVEAYGCEEPYCDENGCYPCDPVAMCVPAEDECQSHNDCAEGQICDDGVCVWEMVLMYAAPFPEGGECDTNADCGPGQICSEGECTYEMVALYSAPMELCDSNADCDAGESCVDGLCQ